MEYDYIECGDCLELMKDIPDKSIDLVIIDPPYEFTSGGGGGAFGADKRSYHAEYSTLTTEAQKAKQEEFNRVMDKTGNDEQAGVWSRKVEQRKSLSLISSGFDNEVLNILCNKMKSINIYVWCSKAQIAQIWNYFTDKGCYLDMITWHKTNPIPTCNNTYLNDTEYCIFAREKGVKVYGTYATKKKYYVTPCNKSDKDKYGHPTIKPLEIIQNLIVNSSNEGDVVLDCFLGSGTTAVACVNTNRHYIGFELNDEYYNIACKRLDEVETCINN